MKNIMLVPTRKERTAERNEKICSEYLQLREEHPDVANNRIFVTIAQLHEMSPRSISAIISRAGIYRPRAGRADASQEGKEEI